MVRAVRSRAMLPELLAASTTRDDRDTSSSHLHRQPSEPECRDANSHGVSHPFTRVRNNVLTAGTHRGVHVGSQDVSDPRDRLAITLANRTGGRSRPGCCSITTIPGGRKRRPSSRATMTTVVVSHRMNGTNHGSHERLNVSRPGNPTYRRHVCGWGRDSPRVSSRVSSATPQRYAVPTSGETQEVKQHLRF